jgi:type VII secretion protein EccB
VASRKDLSQSYQSSVRRLVSGLVLREADPARTPLRRMGGAVFGSVMVAALTLAVAGVIGVVRPGGNTTWQTSGQVVVEEETGARFAYLPDADGTERLHPVPNLASGALLMGTATTVQVSAASLAGVPRGPRLGIPDAPDSMPAPDRLLGAPWTLCSTPPARGSGDEVPDTQLVVGRSTTSGDPVDQAAVLVRDVEDGSLHLVWAGHQYPVPQEDAVLEGLTYRTQPQVQVGTAWLNAMPAGNALVPEPAEGRGEPSALAGAVVGEVRVVGSGEGAQYYQVTREGIEEITAVQKDLLLADPSLTSTVYAGRAVEPVPLSAAEANSVPRAELAERTDADPPAQRPEPAAVTSAESTVCASFTGAAQLPEVSVQAEVAGTDIAAATGGVGADGAVLADSVVVAPGGGAVVLAQGSGTATTGGLFLVTDAGVRYPVPDEDTLAVLGYAGVTPVALPSSLVARLPAGPVLDVADARLPL